MRIFGWLSRSELRASVRGMLLLAGGALALLLPQSTDAQTSIGIYGDTGGGVCTLSDLSPGTINAYVVVRPGANGSTGVQFSAPKPACFTASYVGDVTPAGVLVIGDSQTGISISMLGCHLAPMHVLTIQYLGIGTTSTCCEYPILADPALSDVLSADCAYNEVPAVGVVTAINPDATCSCTGNSVPDEPDSPMPASGASGISVFTSLAWTATDIDNNLAEFDVYFGTAPAPPLVATVTDPAYSPGPLTELQQYYWRVVARDSGGLERSGPEWTFTTRLANSPPAAPTAAYPLNGTVNIPIRMTASWFTSDIDGDTLVYDVYFGTSPVPPLVVASSTVNTYESPTLAGATDYYWRVVARDPLDLETSSPVWTFQTNVGNSPPATPSNPVPVDDASDIATDVTLAWTSSDVEGDPIEFDIYFGTDSGSLPLIASNVDSMSYHLPLLDVATEYFWRVVARDSANAETSGPMWSFQTLVPNIPPLPPSSPSPADLATGVPVLGTLQWQCSDPDGDPLDYDVYLGTSLSPPLMASNLSVKSYAPPALAFTTDYYWRVVAHDSDGGETSGPEWMFTTGVNSPPDPPSNPRPADGGTASTAPTLRWHGHDPDRLPLTYDVYFGDSSPPPLVAAAVTDTIYQPGDLQDATQYYWRVVASDGEFAVSGPEWSFEAVLAHPRVELWADANGSQCSLNDLSPGATINLYVFAVPGENSGVSGVQFAAPKPACFAATFIGVVVPAGVLAIGDSQTGVSLALTGCSAVPVHVLTMQFLANGTSGLCCEYPVIADPEKSDILSSNCAYEEAPAEGGVVTINPNSTCPCAGFNSPPDAPLNPVPANAATGVSSLPSLAWTATDPDNDLAEFDVYLGTVPNPPLVATVTEPGYSPAALEGFKQHYWRIVARDSGGLEQSGPEWTFTTAAGNTAPDPPSNPVPADNGTASTSPTLSWVGSDPEHQPLSYDLYFGDSNPPPLLTAGLFSTNYSTGKLQDTVRYYWRVVASDGEYETSGPVWSFVAEMPAGGNPGRVELWADQQALQCSLSDLSPGPINVYVFAVPGEGGGVTGIQFSAPKPACLSAVYLSDQVAPGGLVIGNSQTGVAVALGGCFTTPTLAMTIQYSGLGTSGSCCHYPVLPDPSLSDVLLVDCDYIETYGTGGEVVVNEEEACPCGVPVLISRFDARVTGRGVEIAWELGGDELAERYTVMRRVGDDAFPRPVVDGVANGTRGSYLDAMVEPATTYHYELVVRTRDGSEYRSPSQTVTTAAATLALGQNHPNPFNPVTAIPYQLPNGANPVRVRLLILDVSGRLVRTLVNEDQTGGAREAVWEGKDDRGNPVSSGIYFYVLDVANQRLTRKLVLLK
ncbi:MAG TPA: FlgD immunoglobulin-like domain containing protein [Candidatus Krumholzibacteria bacterium]|nr:FlgD immunoglobulin-like domain containing protein [Candidatus Krumholzibacteria bacterium]